MASVSDSRKKRQKSAKRRTARFASAPSPSPNLPGMRRNSKNKPILTKNLSADLRPLEFASVSGSPPSKPGATSRVGCGDLLDDHAADVRVASRARRAQAK